LFHATGAQNGGVKYIKDDVTMQRIKFLKDATKNGKAVDWRKRKEVSILLSESFGRLHEGIKSSRVYWCGSSLEFKRYEDGIRKLHDANFCKVRLCPMCAWRRSLKVFGQTSKVMDYITAGNDFRYVFVTLTVKNVKGDGLSSEIDALFSAFERLTRRTEIKRICKGWFRCLEVTHNWGRDDYHPHFHMIMAVNKSYFNNTAYLNHEKWMALWRSCAGLDYDPWVDVRTVKPKPGGDGVMEYKKAVAEVAKYTVKSNDFIIEVKSKDAERKTDEVVLILEKALASRRLYAYGGKLREVHKKLNLDSPEDGDLVNTENDGELRSDLGYVIERYNWHVGYNDYVLEGMG